MARPPSKEEMNKSLAMLTDLMSAIKATSEEDGVQPLFGLALADKDGVHIVCIEEFTGSFAYAVKQMPIEINGMVEASNLPPKEEG